MSIYESGEIGVITLQTTPSGAFERLLSSFLGFRGFFAPVVEETFSSIRAKSPGLECKSVQPPRVRGYATIRST